MTADEHFRKTHSPPKKIITIENESYKTDEDTSHTLEDIDKENNQILKSDQEVTKTEKKKKNVKKTVTKQPDSNKEKAESTPLDSVPLDSVPLDSVPLDSVPLEKKKRVYKKKDKSENK